MRDRPDFLAGQILLINKPYTWTSFDVVKKVRFLLERKLGLKKIKVGHAGTLDPLATGLLIVCTGKFTKRIDELQAQEKEYTGTFTLGATTPSYDLETEINNSFEIKNISESDLYKVAESFIGWQEQIAPLYSAKKIDGERAYLKARRGEDVEVKPNKIHVSEFELTAVDLPLVAFRIKCSKGTYIRSLAHDFGKKLGNGAHLSSLCRTKIGSYLLEDSTEIAEFQEKINSLIELR